MTLAKKDRAKANEWDKAVLEQYANFRVNIRLLRYTTDLTSDKAGLALGFKRGYRYSDLELGRSGPPKLEEVLAIASYFKISLDDLLNKRAEIVFK